MKQNSFHLAIYPVVSWAGNHKVHGKIAKQGLAYLIAEASASSTVHLPTTRTTVAGLWVKPVVQT